MKIKLMKILKRKITKKMKKIIMKKLKIKIAKKMKKIIMKKLKIKIAKKMKKITMITESKEEEKNIINKIKKEEKIKIRSKSKADKVRKCNYKENNTSIDNFEPKEYEEKTTETKILYKTNLDENGKEVLNENLFKYRKKEFSNKQMRKTFTGNFYQRRGSQPKDKKGETFYNYTNKYSNNKTNFNNNAFKSYYGGFKGNNIYNKNKN